MIKDTIKSLSLSATLKINEKSKIIENEGKNIIKFGFGQSPFPVPITIVEELILNLLCYIQNNVENSSNFGLPALLFQFLPLIFYQDQ